MSITENGREPLYVVRQSRIHGRGVFAARYIRKGTKILEYTGEHISNREADRRYDDTRMKRHHTFLFTLDKKTVIDGAISAGGGDASYINHSCDPNCEAVITGKKIFIHALKGIEPGTELAYDYQYERTGKNDDELEKFYVCRCGAENCRGTIMKLGTDGKRSRKNGGGLRRDLNRSPKHGRKKPGSRRRRSHNDRK
jgi:SET domain-containing protein